MHSMRLLGEYSGILPHPPSLKPLAVLEAWIYCMIEGRNFLKFALQDNRKFVQLPFPPR